jgi:hypothetical protein
MSKTALLPAAPPVSKVIQVWAQALFCSPLQQNDQISAESVYVVVAEELIRHAPLPGGCAGAVAQRAGDYPELFAERMAWCLEQAARAYSAPGCDACEAA